MEVDDEAIISAVEKRKALYDRSNPKFSNRKITIALWEEISQELGVDVENVKYRWSHLRDYFLKQYRMYEDHKAGIPIPRKSKWVLYDQLQFLIPYLKQNMKRFVKQEPSDYEKGDKDEDQVSETCEMYENPSGSVILHDDVVTSEPFDVDINDQVIHYKMEPPVRKVKRFRKDLTNIGKSSTSGGQSFRSIGTQINIVSPKRRSPQDDENDHFLKSLLPTIRKLDSVTKLEFRLEIQKLLLHFAKQSKETDTAVASLQNSTM